jgi:hypothetical protein
MPQLNCKLCGMVVIRSSEKIYVKKETHIICKKCLEKRDVNSFGLDDLMKIFNMK